MNVPPNFWPAPLSHLVGPYLGAADESVVVAEITDEPANGCTGVRMLFSALVPLAEVDAVLSASGGIGYTVESHGPHPVVPPEGGWSGEFWVRGINGDKKRYEALVHGWTNHNRTVMLPDNGFLMCYGLVPRLLSNGQTAWDDPQKPVYDVVTVKPLSRYEVPSTFSPAEVRVNRTYLEDYASLKGCAVVAVFFEQRYSSRDPDVAAALGDSENKDFELPGRLLNLQCFEPRQSDGANQLLQIWGCRLILKPNGRPVSEELDPALHWPDFEQVVTPEQALRMRSSDWVYVKDDVLQEWEGREEFSVGPKSGYVSYGGWWATSYSHRVGRHHIAVELKKLYEGTPPFVIRHFHRFAVRQVEVDRDLKNYGDRHIGIRAEELIDAFLGLTQALAKLAKELELPIEQEEFGGLDAELVRYRGWWTMDELSSLGHVVPLAIGEADFLARCMQLYQLLERLKPGPLKQLLNALEFPKRNLQALGQVGAIRLFGTLCQLAEIADEKGLRLASDVPESLQYWDEKRQIPSLASLFALNSMRNVHGHVQGDGRDAKLRDALSKFGLDIEAMRSGWGLALDAVYDRLISNLRECSDLLLRTSD